MCRKGLSSDIKIKGLSDFRRCERPQSCGRYVLKIQASQHSQHQNQYQLPLGAKDAQGLGQHRDVDRLGAESRTINVEGEVGP